MPKFRINAGEINCPYIDIEAPNEDDEVFDD